LRLGCMIKDGTKVVSADLEHVIAVYLSM
jgi:hypothetical protein